ncbi:hypothetical protein Tco_0327297 [Tanacetum coccineum]
MCGKGPRGRLWGELLRTGVSGPATVRGSLPVQQHRNQVQRSPLNTERPCPLRVFHPRRRSTVRATTINQRWVLFDSQSGGQVGCREGDWVGYCRGCCESLGSIASLARILGVAVHGVSATLVVGEPDSAADSASSREWVPASTGRGGECPLRTLSRWDRASILGVPGQYGFSLVDGGMHVRREWVRSSGAVAVTGAKELGRNVGDNCEEEKDKRRIARRMKLKIAGALTVGYVDRSEK